MPRTVASTSKFETVEAHQRHGANTNSKYHDSTGAGSTTHVHTTTIKRTSLIRVAVLHRLRDVHTGVGQDATNCSSGGKRRTEVIESGNFSPTPTVWKCLSSSNHVKPLVLQHAIVRPVEVSHAQYGEQFGTEEQQLHASAARQTHRQSPCRRLNLGWAGSWHGTGRAHHILGRQCVGVVTTATAPTESNHVHNLRTA